MYPANTRTCGVTQYPTLSVNSGTTLNLSRSNRPLFEVAASNPPPGKFPVKLSVSEHDKDVFLAAGASGAAALYTKHLGPVHIIRKVLMRVESYLDYIIIKHSISVH